MIYSITHKPAQIKKSFCIRQNVSSMFFENDLSRTTEIEFNKKTILTNIEYFTFTVFIPVSQEMFLEIEYIFSPKFI